MTFNFAGQTILQYRGTGIFSTILIAFLGSQALAMQTLISLLKRIARGGVHFMLVMGYLLISSPYIIGIILIITSLWIVLCYKEHLSRKSLPLLIALLCICACSCFLSITTGGMSLENNARYTHSLNITTQAIDVQKIQNM